MKHWPRALLCCVLLTAFFIFPSASAQTDVPQKQGDFYVLVNGSYVTFPDAVPQLKNGRSCLPFVAVFEQLGFAEEDMTWDGETSTVTATKHNVSYSTPFTNREVRQGDVTVTLTIGSTEFLVSYSGDTTADSHGNTVPVSYAFQTEAAPYLDLSTKRTYIPFGLVADALGYKVGWDAQTGAVIIDDVDAILASNTASYAWMDAYLDWYRTFSSPTYQFTGDYDYTISLPDPDSGVDTIVTYDGTCDMITRADHSAFSGQIRARAEVAFRHGTQDVTDTVLELSSLSPSLRFADVVTQMRGDTAANTLYTNTQYPSGPNGLLGDSSIPEGAWVKTRLAQENAAFAFAAGSPLLSDRIVPHDDTSFSELLRAMLLECPLNDVNQTYSDYLAFLNELYADSAFTRSNSGLTSSAQWEGVSHTLTLSLSGSRVIGCSSTQTQIAAGMGTSTTTTTCQDDRYTSSYLYAREDQSSFLLELSGRWTPASQSPQTQPPSGAAIIDRTHPY